VVDSALDPKTANARYHDAAAETYDRKWSIGFDEVALGYVRDRARRMLPAERFDRALDISPGMLAVLVRNAARLGCAVESRIADAERLPYPDRSFDLVAGHAVLHHLPDPPAALTEWHRVLRPGGVLFLSGEPTRWGDRLAGVAKAAARTTWRRAATLPGLGGIVRQDREPGDERDRILRDLEFDVDLHTFHPDQVVRWARDAGFVSVRVDTEELLASLLGWAVRTIEAEARPGLLGRRWARGAYLGWRAFSAVDRALARALPKGLFYNLLLSGKRA
jgi:SAM-dependent methyltransferase